MDGNTKRRRRLSPSTTFQESYEEQHIDYFNYIPYDCRPLILADFNLHLITRYFAASIQTNTTDVIL